MIYLRGMELTLINDIKNICQRLEMSPTKDRGQNFLVNSEVVDKMVDLAEVSRNDVVLEIGPGLGILTQRLVARAGRVVAVELDGKLYEYLSERFKGIKNLELVKADGLKWLEAGGVGRGDYKVVANLPYQITSRILRLLLSRVNPPSGMVVMVQKEVGERMVAKPGKMSVLSVMVQYYGQPVMVGVVKKGNFWPKPKVDSGIVKVDRVREYAEEDELFFKVVKVGFLSRRKMLKNNLGNVYGEDEVVKILGELGLNLKVRAQELRVEDWINLVRKLEN